MTAPAFISVYDTTRAHGPEPVVQRMESEELTGQILTRIRGWAVQVERDVPGFDRSAYGDRPKVADDVISDARNLLLVVERHESASGPLPYAQAMRDDLEPLLDLAHTEWEESNTARSKQSEAQAAVRKAADAFWRDLIAFRRSLAAAVGRTHPDFQKLRTARSRTADVDDDAIGASLPDGTPAVDPHTDASNHAPDQAAS